MKIKRDGIYKTIDSKDYGIYQKSGWEKVIIDVAPTKELEKVTEKIIIDEPAPIIDVRKDREEEIVEPDQPFQEEPKVDELPKSKKKKK